MINKNIIIKDAALHDTDAYWLETCWSWCCLNHEPLKLSSFECGEPILCYSKRYVCMAVHQYLLINVSQSCAMFERVFIGAIQSLDKNDILLCLLLSPAILIIWASAKIEHDTQTLIGNKRSSKVLITSIWIYLMKIKE